MCYSILANFFLAAKDEHFKNVEEMTQILRRKRIKQPYMTMLTNGQTACVVHEYTGLKSLWRVHFDRIRNFHFINKRHAITEL